uniref:Suf domain-containing protein n=1 Tax=Panagrellus redivivus TaxID=6233 RepID=A0A7E4VQ74_PANRE
MGRSRSRSPSRERRTRRRSRSRSKSSSPDPRIRDYKDLQRDVKEDPYSFETWTRLLALVEDIDEIKYARESFEAFLKRYPYCYGYWRKYADFERRHRNFDRAVLVFEKGVSEIPLSVDLWISYVDYLKSLASNKRDAVKKLRHLFMRAAQGCGSDFRSDPIWTRFIDFEIEHVEYQRAMAVYDLIFTTPTIGFAEHWTRFTDFINSREPDEILTSEEYQDITKELLRDRLKNHEGPLYNIEEYQKQIVDDDENIDTVVQKRKRHVDIALTAFRETILERRRKTYQNNEREINKRWAFEGAIKRPYFHTKPLDREQLRNWHNYIDFEIAQPDSKASKKRIEVLFERCLIACALYEEMWIKYGAYLDSNGETSLAKKIFKKAVEVHCSRKPAVALAYSAFEEKHGDPETADRILVDFQRRNPGYAAIENRRIAISRRRIQRSKADKGDYSEIVSKYERLMNDLEAPKRLGSFYALKLARLHLKVRHDRKSADKTLREAINRDRSNTKLYLALIDVHNSSSHFKEADILDAFDLAIKSRDLTLEERYSFSQRKVDFLEELGMDPSKLNEAIAIHLALETQMPVPPSSMYHGKRIYTGKDEEVDRKRTRHHDGPSLSERASALNNFPANLGGMPPVVNGIGPYGAPPPNVYPPSGYAGFNPAQFAQPPPNMMAYRAQPNVMSAEQLKPLLGLPSGANGSGQSSVML